MDTKRVECSVDLVDSIEICDDSRGDGTHVCFVAISNGETLLMVFADALEVAEARNWLTGWLREYGHEEPATERAPKKTIATLPSGGSDVASQMARLREAAVEMATQDDINVTAAKTHIDTLTRLHNWLARMVADE